MKKVFLSFLQILFMPTILWAAVAFDGTGDEERIVDPNQPGTTWTVCGRLNLPAFVDGETIAYYGNGPDSAAGRGWAIEETNDDATHGKIKLTMFDGASAYTMNSPQLTTNTDYAICWVGRGSPDSEIYINATDGLADGTNDTDAYVAQNATDDFVIGTAMPNRTGAGANDSAAKVAHFAAWTIALSGAEIASIHDNSTCPDAIQNASLQFFLPLDAAGSVTDIGPHTFTVVEGGNPTTDAGPGGLPTCGSGGGTGGATVETTLKAMGYH